MSYGFETASTETLEVTGKAKIKVIGVGGAGNNAVNHLIESGIDSAEFIAINTDAQDLSCCLAPHKIAIGKKLTKGLGAGANPAIGSAAAEESKDEIAQAIDGADLLFITAGMGGGTGTGAAPVVASIAKQKGILTVGFVTKPFAFEGRRKMENALKGIENLRKYVDALIIVPNEKIIESTRAEAKKLGIREAFHASDDILKQGIRGIADVIVKPGLINLDFADVRTVLKESGLAHMGVGVAKGENRIVDAVRFAVNCPLLETTIEGATSVILYIVGGDSLTIDEVSIAADLIQGVIDLNANVIFGAGVDSDMGEEISITVIATGFAYSAPVAQPEQARMATPVVTAPIAPVAPAPAPVAPAPVVEEQVAPAEEKKDPVDSSLPSFIQSLLGGKK